LSKEFTNKDIENVVYDPAYALGVVYEPHNEIVEWVKLFTHFAPDKFWRASTRERIDVFVKFFLWLEENHYIERTGKAPVLINNEEWIRALLVSKNDLKAITKRMLSKQAKIKTFIKNQGY
jgi:hypothetical protein